jgi:hypothetical protein
MRKVLFSACISVYVLTAAVPNLMMFWLVWGQFDSPIAIAQQIANKDETDE